MKVAKVLDSLREEYGEGLYKGTSFKTHAAFGPHSAMPHYANEPATNVAINTSAPMLLDSGGQYLGKCLECICSCSFEILQNILQFA